MATENETNRALLRVRSSHQIPVPTPRDGVSVAVRSDPLGDLLVGIVGPDGASLVDPVTGGLNVNIVGGGGGGGIPVPLPVVAADPFPVFGPLTDSELRASPVPISASALPLPTGAATEATLASRLAEATFTARIPTNGQKVMAASLPVVVASDQSALQVVGDVANDAPDGASNPIKMGTRAANAFPAAVANGDRVNAIGDTYGRPLVAHIDPNMQISFTFNATTQQAAALVRAAPGAGLRLVITNLIISAYATTPARLRLYFGAGAYNPGVSPVVTTTSFAPSASSAPGMVCAFAVPYYGPVNTDLRVTTDAAMSFDINIVGYLL